MSIFKVAAKFKNTLASASTQMKWDLHKTADYANILADSVESPETRKLAEQTYELWSMVAGAESPIGLAQLKSQLKTITQLSTSIYGTLKTASDRRQLAKLMETLATLQLIDADLHATASIADANKYMKGLGAKSLADMTDAQVIEYYRLKDPSNVANFQKYPQDVQAKFVSQLREVPVEETPPETPPTPTPTPSPAPTAPKTKPKATPSTIGPVSLPHKALYDDGDLINKDIQRALIKLFPGSEKWIKVDGIFGPNTRGAINRYKATYHDDRNMTDPQFQADLINRGEEFEVHEAVARPLRTKTPWESR